MLRALQPHRITFSSFAFFLTLILYITIFARPVFAGWARLYGDPSRQEIYDSVQTPDGGYLLVGATRLDSPPTSGLVVKLNSLGQVVWARFYGAQNQVFRSVISLPNGNYLIAGKTEFFGTPDCLLVEIDPTGTVVALRTYGGSGSDTCFAVARAPDGNFILAGRSNSAGAGNFDAWLLKVNSSYGLIWSKLYGTPPVAGSSGIEELYALVTTSESGAIAVGKTHSFTTNNSADVLALRVDGTGNILWTSVFNGVFGSIGWWDAAHDIVSLTDGSVMLTGFAYMGTSYDLLLLQLDSGSGAPMFNATYGDITTDKGQSLVETPTGEIVIAGTVGGATGVRALFTKLDAARNVAFANVLGPAASASEFTANILDVASYFVSGYSLGYVPNGDAMGVKVNDQVTIAGCADLTATTLNRGAGVTPRASTVVTTDFSITPDSYFLNTAPLALSETTICTDEAVSGPDINVVPPSHNYGTVLVGQQIDKVFQVRNLGNANLNIGVVTDPAAPFSKVADACSSAVLAPLALCDITIRYAPTAAGTHNSSFQIPSNDPDENPFTVNLSGSAALAIPDITVTPTSWNFGDVNVGSQSDKVIQVRNDGTGNLTIGAVTNPPAPFSKTADTCSNAVLAPLATCNITTRFAPTAFGPSSGNFNIPSDDPDESSVNVALSGTGVGPDIHPDPQSLEFGVVRLGSSETLTLTLWNTGNRDLAIGAYSLSPPFSIQNDNCWARVLTPFSFCTMGIQFIPEVTDEVLVAFEIASNDPDENPLTVPLRGRGIAPPTLTAPANDVYVSDPPTFRMTTNPTGIATLHYRVEISTNNFATLLWIYDQMTFPDGWSKTEYAPGETAELVPTFPLGSGDYQWRALVHYHNEGAFSDYSEVRSFRVPASPTLLSPAPYATVSSRPTFTMTWNNPGTPTTLRYILEILDSTGANVLRTYDQRTSGAGWSQPQYAPGDTAAFQVPANDPLPEGTYYWRVRVFLDDFGALSPPSLLTLFGVALPTITHLYPQNFVNGAIRSFSIYGRNFQSGATIRLVCTDCASPVKFGQIPGVIQQLTSNYIESKFDLVDPDIMGHYNLEVMNPDGDKGTRAVFVDPAVIWVDYEWDGVRGFPVVPPGNERPNYLTLGNMGPDAGIVWMTIEPPDPGIIRLKVGWWWRGWAWDSTTAEDKTTVHLLIPIGSYESYKYTPLWWGISPEDVVFPAGFSPSSGHGPQFGQNRHVTVKGLGGATREQVEGMFISIVTNTLCNNLKDRIAAHYGQGGDPNILDNAIDAVMSELQDATDPKKIFQKVAEHLLGVPGWVGIATSIAQCAGQLVGELINSWHAHTKQVADSARDNDEAMERLQNRVSTEWRGRLTGRTALIRALSEPPCSPPPRHDQTFSGTIMGPWDPNDKLTNTTFPCERVTDANGLPQCARYFVPMANAGDPIEYVIRFENKAEATGEAVNVVITDVLDSDLDPTTLNVIITSHPAVFQTPEITGQTVTFRFNDINLPPNVNPPEGEGFVQFTVRPRPGLPVGAEIRNKASIVFDFNPPIETPEVVHILGLADLSVAPPSHNFGTVSVAGGSAARQFNVTNVGGQPLHIASVQIAGADAAHFSTRNDNCSTRTLEFNASCTLDVVFSPTSPGAKSAVLRIASNDADTPTLDVPLTGTGEGPSVIAARGPATLPTTAQKGALRVPVLQFRLTAGAAESINIEGLTLQAGGDGNDRTDIVAVRLFLDSNANGRVDAGEAELWTGQYSADNGVATVAIAPRTIPANGSETYLVTYDFAQQLASVNKSSIPSPYLATAGTGQPTPRRRSSLPAPFIPVAAILLLTVSLVGFRRHSPRSSQILLLLVIATGFYLLTSCGGGGARPAATRSYQATLNSVLARGATTSLQASVNGTPISGSAITVQK